MLFTPSIHSRVMARVKSVIADAQESLDEELSVLKQDLRNDLHELHEEYKKDRNSLIETHVQRVFSKIL